MRDSPGDDAASSLNPYRTHMTGSHPDPSSYRPYYANPGVVFEMVRETFVIVPP